ncbi:MAG TPA: hypothetical protein VE870_14890 [Bacteroidales bacterium]|nr:hypothetical protein [Bacteroidales bacterium]
MKLDFDTLIYLIVTLVFVALGLLGKKKPRTNIPNAAQGNDEESVETETSTADVFSENFRRIMGEYDAEYNTEQSIIPDQEVKMEMAAQDIEERAERLDTVADALNRIEGTFDKDEDAESDELMDSDFDDEIKMSEREAMGMRTGHRHDINWMLDNFDIRKAIIYSEIINPKYF